MTRCASARVEISPPLSRAAPGRKAAPVRQNGDVCRFDLIGCGQTAEAELSGGAGRPEGLHYE